MSWQVRRRKITYLCRMVQTFRENRRHGFHDRPLSSRSIPLVGTIPVMSIDHQKFDIPRKYQYLKGI